MPVRVVCPACATQLNIRDEHAGRAVKCPKCNYVIPPAQAAPPVAPPGAELPQTPGVSAAPENYGPAPYSRPPEPPPFSRPADPPPLPSMPPPVPTPPSYRPAVPRPMDLDNDERSLPPRPTAKPTGRRDPDDDDRPPRPSARPTGRKRDEDDDDRPARAGARPAGRKRDDDDDDRPPRRPGRPRNDDDDDDDSLALRPPKAKSNTPLILLIVGGLLLTCCGGVGYGIYYFVKKAREVVQSGVDEFDRFVDVSKYRSAAINMNRVEVENLLGPGQIATAADIEKTFSPTSTSLKDWSAKASAGRVLIWHFGENTVLCCFHPDIHGRLQAKVWENPEHRDTAQDGWIDDQKYLDLRSTRPVPGAPEPPATPITAQELAKAYKDNAAEADKKYKEKWFLVEGKVYDIQEMPLSTTVLLVGLEGGGKPTYLGCEVFNVNSKEVWKLSRGQKVKMRGRVLAGSDASRVSLSECKLDSQEADPTPQLQAIPWLNEFTKDPKGTDEKYKDKDVTLLSAVVESKEDSALILVAPGKKGPAIKIKATWPFDSRKQLSDVKVGQRVTIKGEYSGFFDNTISINRCWLVP